jgi:tetratricopeptide (TPR) repeat protein
MRGMGRTAALFLAAAFLAGCQSQQQIGQIKPEMKAQYDLAFQEMLGKPGNLDVALKYATVAKEAGDLEGAIGTYESLLLIGSDLPELRVELGTLYYRLKSYDAARAHFEAALASPTLPAALRKPTLQILSKMPKQRVRS